MAVHRLHVKSKNSKCEVILVCVGANGAHGETTYSSHLKSNPYSEMSKEAQVVFHFNLHASICARLAIYEMSSRRDR